MKKILALVLALAIVMSLSACGSKPTAPDDDNKVLSYAGWLVMPQEWIDQVKADTGITLEYEQIESKNYADIITTRLSGGSAPDIFYAYNLDCVKNYAAAGYAIDLTGNAWLDENIRADYIDEAKKYGDGKVYGFSEVISAANVFFYNKDIFAKYNLECPTNIDELVAVCDTLLENGVTPFIHSASEANHLKRLAFEPITIVNANEGGSEWIEGLATGESKFTDDIYVKASQYYVDAVNKGYFSDLCTGITHVEAWQLFCEGEAAMMTGATFYFDQNYKDVRPDFDLGVAAEPMNFSGDAPVCGQKYGEFIMGNANNGKDEVITEYLQYFAEHLADWTKYTGMATPSTKSLGDWADYAWMFDVVNACPMVNLMRQPSTVQGDLEAWEQGVFAGTAGMEGPEMLQAKLDAVI